MKDKFYSDILENLSEQGAYINTSIKFNLGDSTTMLVSLPGLNRSIKSKGKIVRYDENGIAVKFNNKLPGFDEPKRLFY